MNAVHLLFRTNLFNLSKVSEHFINPCCFGEDLARWLKSRLADENIETSGPYQEDWGWELPASFRNDSYYVCVSGNPDVPGADEGEWRIIVEKRRSIWKRVTGKGRIEANDPLVGRIEAILSGESGIGNVGRE